MFRFSPKSYTATRRTGPRARSAGPTTASASYGSGVVTEDASSAPAIPGVSRTRATSDAGSRSRVETPARIAPTSRIRRVSLRVSMPSIATTPAAASDSPSVASACRLEERRDASVTANAETWIRSLSAWSACSP